MTGFSTVPLLTVMVLSVITLRRSLTVCPFRTALNASCTVAYDEPPTIWASETIARAGITLHGSRTAIAFVWNHRASIRFAGQNGWGSVSLS